MTRGKTVQEKAPDRLRPAGPRPSPLRPGAGERRDEMLVRPRRETGLGEADQKRRQGSVLLATLLIAVLVATLCASFMQLSLHSLRQSTHAVQYNAATDLAEAGLEEALWALNNKAVSSANGWTLSGSDAWRVFHAGASALSLGDVYKGELRVRLDGHASSSVTIISEARILHPSAPTVLKQIKVTVTASSGGAQGIIINNSIVFNNRPKVDSYDSSKGFYNATTNRGDKVSVVSMSGYIQTNDAQIWGRVGVGSANASGVGAPMNGGFLRNSETQGSTTFDTAAITTGLTMNWPPTPTPPSISETGGSTLTVTTNATHTLGDPSSSQPTYYYYTANGGNMSLSENTVLKINGPVVLVIQRGLSISGNAKILFDSNPNAKLSIYASENINASGTLTLNDQPEASRLTIYGSGSGGQNIALGGTTTFTGVFHGPGWNVNVNSGVNWSGAMLANYANFSSSMNFHYDTALGGSGTPKIASWQTLREAAGTGSSYAKDSRTPF